MLYLLILFLAAALWILIEFISAPAGYEDEMGFHFENPKENMVINTVEKKDPKSIFVLTS